MWHLMHVKLAWGELRPCYLIDINGASLVNIGRTMSIYSLDEEPNYTTLWQDFRPVVAWGTLVLFSLVLMTYIGLCIAAMRSLFPPLIISTLLVVNAYASFTVLHEAGHGNIFPSQSAFKFMESWVGWLACLPLLVFPYRIFKIVHDRHHAFTNNPDLDPDYYGEIDSWSQALAHSALIPYKYYKMCMLVSKSDSHMRSALRNTVAYLTLMICLFAALCITGHGVELLIYVLLPAVLCLMIITLFFDYIPHQPHRSLDRYRNTRAFGGAVLNVLMLGQNYHLMHHMFPRVPWYRYRPLFFKMKPDLVEHGAALEHMPNELSPGLFKSNGGDCYLDAGRRVNMVLKIGAITALTNEAKHIEFLPVGGAPLIFSAGQYITLSKRIKGQYHSRCYSIVAAPYEHALGIAVKNTGGVFSSFLCKDLSVGDDILVQGPFGTFIRPAHGAADLTSPTLLSAERNVVKQDACLALIFIVAGSGITPVLSIIKAELSDNVSSKIYLIYANRSAAEAMFLAEINDLCQAHGNRFEFISVLKTPAKSSADPKGGGKIGRLDQKELMALLQQYRGPAAQGQRELFYISGPRGFNAMSSMALIKMGIPEACILTESFTVEITQPEGIVHRLMIANQDSGVGIEIAENQTLLDAALLAGIHIPNACREGMCGSCKVRVERGTVTAIPELCTGLLSEEEVAGFSLACQCRPTSDVVVSWL